MFWPAVKIAETAIGALSGVLRLVPDRLHGKGTLGLQSGGNLLEVVVSAVGSAVTAAVSTISCIDAGPPRCDGFREGY